MRNTWLVLALLATVSFAVPTGLSIEINGGDDYTNTTSVTLALSATGAANCSLSNDAGFSPNSTYAYSSLPTSWSLASGDGSKTVYFKCVDTSGNWSSAVNDGITLDAAQPAVSSKSPTSSSVTDRTPEISADVSDSGSGVDSSSIVLKLDNSTVSHAYSSGEVTYTPSSDLAIGPHNVGITLSDNAGNMKTDSWSFTIVSEGVGFEDETPEDGSWTSDDRPDVYVTLVDTGSGINMDSLTFDFDGTDVTDDTEYSSSSKKYSYEPASLDDGNYTVEVCAEDDVAKETCFEWNFGIDTTEPDISLLTPSDGRTVTSVNVISARLEDDDSGIDEDTITFYLNEIDVTSSVDYDDDDGDLEFEPSVKLTGGTYDVEIWVEDNAGNRANIEWSFTIPTTAPTLSAKTPTPDSTITNLRPEISVDIDDPGTSGIDSSSLKMYLDGDIVDADWSSGTLSYTPSKDLSDGEHTIRVIAENNNNERTDSQWTFEIDLSAPNPPTNFKAEPVADGVKLTWTAPSGIDGYMIYSSTSTFTSLAGRNPISEPSAGDTTYTHSTSGRRYYAIVSVNALGTPSTPVFASPCAEYKSGSWNEYECCVDSDCDSGYYCNTTAHRCEESPEFVSEDDAQDAIDDAEATIETAENAGKDVTDAENLLNSAKNSFTTGNYEEAERLAELARETALSAPYIEDGELEEESEKKQLPCCPSFIILAVLLFSALMANK